MPSKFQFNLIKVENKTKYVNCFHESAAASQAHSPVVPSRHGWAVWGIRFLKVGWFCVRVFLALHGADPDFVGLAYLGFGFITDVMSWLKEVFKK